MCRFVTPAAVAAAAVLAVAPPVAQCLADAPMLFGMLIIGDPTLADEVSPPPVVYQPHTGDSHLWRGRDDQRTLPVALPNLLRGRYTVTWHGTSLDTHKTQGRFDFTAGS